MNMHKESGEKLTFVLTGIYMQHPNMCCTSGYGSDDWYFGAKYNGKDHVLYFTHNPSYGTKWSSAAITEADAKNLLDLSDGDWIRMTAPKNICIWSIHPDSIEDARKIMKRTNTNCGPLSDEAIYGMY